MDSFKRKVLLPLFTFTLAAAVVAGFVLTAAVVTLAWIQILG